MPQGQPGHAAPHKHFTGYVLAGGRSSRMGRDKAFLEVEGKPLVEDALDRLQPVCSQVKILSGPPDFERDALLSCYAHLVSDSDSTYEGPLAALAAALQDCPTPYALLLAVDQPELSVEALAFLAATEVSGQACAACFAREGVVEPLPMLVATDLLSAVLQTLQSGERRLLNGILAAAAIQQRDVLFIQSPREKRLFTNLNWPEDYKVWRNRSVESNDSDFEAS